MTDIEHPDPADELRRDIESSYAELEGQNREPEPVGTPQDEAIAESLEDAPAKEDASRERDEKGRFVARDAEDKTEEPSEPVKKPAEPVKDDAQLTEAKVEVRPPPGFSVASKAIWDTLPQSVRDDIAKREQEVDSGFKRYSGLGKFAEEAEKNGTTLQNAVNDYVAVETALKQNFVGGIEFICQRMNINPARLVQAMAARYPSVQTAPAAQTNGATQPPAAAPLDAEAMTRHFQQIARAEAERGMQLVQQQAERREIDAKIASFSADPKNKFFPNVRQDMAIIVQSGKAETIDQAYEAACWLNPEIRAILINEANSGRSKQAEVAASKARNAAKAVGGSPAPGVNPDVSGKRQDLNLEDEIRAAVDSQVGAA